MEPCGLMSPEKQGNVGPVPNGRFMAFQMGVTVTKYLLTRMILQQDCAWVLVYLQLPENLGQIQVRFTMHGSYSLKAFSCHGFWVGAVFICYNPTTPDSNARYRNFALTSHEDMKEVVPCFCFLLSFSLLCKNTHPVWQLSTAIKQTPQLSK